MQFIKDNLVLVIGSVFLFATITVRIFLHDDHLIWISSIGVYVFITAVLAHFYVLDTKLRELAKRLPKDTDN